LQAEVHALTYSNEQLTKSNLDKNVIIEQRDVLIVQLKQRMSYSEGTQDEVQQLREINQSLKNDNMKKTENLELQDI